MEKTLEEIQADLQAALDTIAAKEASIAALETTNKSLKQEKIDAKTAAENAAKEALLKSGDLESIKAAHAAELAEVQQAIETERTARHEIVKQHDLTAAFAAARVDPIHIGILKDAHLPKISVQDGVAVIGDKPVADHFAEFFAGPGAAYVQQAKNSDAGIGLRERTGSTANWSLDEYSRIAKNNPAAAAAFAAHHGKDYLNTKP